jgi:H+/Cl- antiporter ClcA
MKDPVASRAGRGLVSLAAALALVLGAIRVWIYVAIWQTDGPGKAFKQLRSDAEGLLWLLVFVAFISGLILLLGWLVRLLRKSLRGGAKRGPHFHEAPTVHPK